MKNSTSIAVGIILLLGIISMGFTIISSGNQNALSFDTGVGKPYCDYKPVLTPYYLPRFTSPSTCGSCTWIKAFSDGNGGYTYNQVTEFAVFEEILCDPYDYPWGSCAIGLPYLICPPDEGTETPPNLR